LKQVVLAERLRKVGSLIGFTRIESAGDYTEIGDFPQEQRVRLSRTAPKWVPTSDIRGEGVFLQFSEQVMFKDGLTLHGAACHACLFLPETSCERGNKYLDRSVLVSTVESANLAFFSDYAEPLPEATITAETDETITPPQPAETTLSEIDELVDSVDE